MSFNIEPSRWQPVLLDGVPDKRDGIITYEKFWEEEVRRCIEGYKINSEMISGDFYFWLNHWKITGENGIQSPWYTDLHHELYNELEYCKLYEQDLCLLKARDKGFSYVGAEFVAHPFLFKSQGVGLVGGYLKEYADDVMLKVSEGFNNMSRELKVTLRKRATKDALRLKSGFLEIEDGAEHERGLDSKLYAKSYKQGDGASIGKRTDRAWYEEGPHMPDLLTIIIKDRPMIKKGSLKFGLRVVGGTAGKFNEESKDFMSLYNNCEAYGFRKFFIPGSKFYIPFIFPDGTSDEVSAKESILQERNLLKKDNSPKGKKAFWDFVREVCLTEEEAMVMGGINNFDLEKLNTQRSKILTSQRLQKLVQKGNLEWVTEPNGSKTLKWVQSKNGKIEILLHPEPGYSLTRPLDVIGIDSYDQTKAETTNSQGALVVHRRFGGIDKAYELPICIYADRPEDENIFYETCLKICIYYNTKALVEYTKIGILTYFQNHKMHQYLKERPLSADVIGTKMTNRYGVHMMEPQKIQLRAKLKENIDFFCDQILFESLLSELIKFGSQNTDIAMAYGIALMHSSDIVLYPPEKEGDRSEKQERLQIGKRIRSGDGFAWESSVDFDHE